MTRDEILAMKPGRELDALVAEKVMGWVEFSPIDPTIDFGVHGKYRWNYAKDPKDGKQKPIPWYSEDIAAAWEVFEKNGYYGNVSYMGLEYVCTLWSKWDDEGLGVNVTATGDTAPEAICKAALLAVMDGEDEHERD